MADETEVVLSLGTKMDPGAGDGLKALAAEARAAQSAVDGLRSMVAKLKEQEESLRGARSSPNLAASRQGYGLQAAGSTMTYGGDGRAQSGLGMSVQGYGLQQPNWAEHLKAKKEAQQQSEEALRKQTGAYDLILTGEEKLALKVKERSDQIRAQNALLAEQEKIDKELVRHGVLPTDRERMQARVNQYVKAQEDQKKFQQLLAQRGYGSTGPSTAGQVGGMVAGQLGIPFPTSGMAAFGVALAALTKTAHAAASSFEGGHFAAGKFEDTLYKSTLGHIPGGDLLSRNDIRSGLNPASWFTSSTGEVTPASFLFGRRAADAGKNKQEREVLQAQLRQLRSQHGGMAADEAADAFWENRPEGDVSYRRREFLAHIAGPRAQYHQQRFAAQQAGYRQMSALEQQAVGLRAQRDQGFTGTAATFLGVEMPFQQAIMTQVGAATGHGSITREQQQSRIQEQGQLQMGLAKEQVDYQRALEPIAAKLLALDHQRVGVQEQALGLQGRIKQETASLEEKWRGGTISLEKYTKESTRILGQHGQLNELLGRQNDLQRQSTSLQHDALQTSLQAAKARENLLRGRHGQLAGQERSLVQQGQQMQESLGLMSPMDRSAIMGVARKLHAGQELSGGELQFAAGHRDIFGAHLQRIGMKRAAPEFAELARMGFGPQQQLQAVQREKMQLEQQIKVEVTNNQTGLAEQVANKVFEAMRRQEGTNAQQVEQIVHRIMLEFNRHRNANMNVPGG